MDGCQVVVVNKFDERLQFYQQIPVEKLLRTLKEDKDVSNIYFLVLFACCRESFIPFKNTAVKNEKMKDGLEIERVLVRGGDDLGITNTNASNFTFVFGCDPAAGVAADTKFVKIFIEHLKGLFSLEDGSALIPDCLGTIDSIKGNVNFESTSSNMGRNLQVFC